MRAKRRFVRTCKSAVAVLSSASILLSSVTQTFAQTLLIGDPSAPGTGFLQTSNGTPQVDIATPQSGVSVNKFSEFNVGAEGLILNNSTSAGVSVIGQNVTANPNLVSGPATTIVNEVTSAAPSALAGTTEVFGQSAAVIIANPNGIACNGCSFLNSTSSVLTTGAPSVNGSDVDLLVTEGTVTIGPNGFSAGQQAGVLGRHVIVTGPVSTDAQDPANSLVIAGGAQQATALDFSQLSNSSIVAAPSLVAKTSPFAVDASEAGTLTGGEVRVLGLETDQGVNIYGDVDGNTLQAVSAGDLFYKDVTVALGATLQGQAIRQYGDLTATRDVTISGDSFTLYDGRKLITGHHVNGSGELEGKIAITVDDFAVIAGEVSGAEITVDIANGSLTNNGFLLSDGELTVVAGDSVLQQRKIATEYDIYYDPVLQNYLDAYYAQLLDGGEAADLAAELIARAGAHEIIAEYIDDGATASGTNVSVTASTGDFVNTGGAIAATNNVVLTAGIDIINEFLALKSRLGAEDGCAAQDCGYRTDFHAGELLAGNDLSLVAGRNIENRASDMAAAQNMSLTAGQDVINSLKTSNFEASEYVAVELVGPRIVYSGKEYSIESFAYDQEYTANDLYFEEKNILSPARIATLYGNVDIAAGSDFISQASEISSGADLTINAAGQAIFTSYVDDERKFIERVRREANETCTGGDTGTCTKSIINITTVDESFALATATSNLVGRSVSVTSGENLTILGARFLAAVDLDLQSTTKSVLIDSTDLPDTIALDRTQGVEFVELTDDLVGQIFRPADFDQQHAAYGVTYATLIGNAGVADAARDDVATDAVGAILGEAVQAWRLGHDDPSTSTVSEYLSLLQTDAARREAVAQSLLFAVATALETQGEAATGSLATGLDEYAMLQQLITDDASAAALDTAALALLDALLPQILSQTQSLEASLPSAADLPSLTSQYIAAQESILLDEIIAELSSVVPTDGAPESTTAFEQISVDQGFMQALAARIADTMAQDMGRAPLFGAPDENGVYADADQLIDIESDAALQRLVLELSLILSPGNPDTIPTATELSTLVTGGTSTEHNILKISEKLSEFAALAVNAVASTIDERDRVAQAEAVLALDATGLSVDTALTDALVAAVAGSFDTQAAANYQAAFEQNSTDFASLLADNKLLTAVEALRRAQSGADIKDAARSVGVQSFVSLIDSDTLTTLKADASTAVDDLHGTFGTQVDALNGEISTYHSDVRDQLGTLTDLLTAPDATVQAAMQPALDQVQADYDAAVASADQAYQDQLAANEAEYGPLLTTQEWVFTGAGKCGCGGYWTTVPNQYYVDLKDAADAQALDTYDTALTDAETQRLLEVASVEAAYTDPGLQAQIDTLQSDYDTQMASYASQKTAIFDTLNTQITAAVSKIQLALAEQASQDELRANVMAVGTVDPGAPSLAAALSDQEFPDLGQIGTLQANALGVVENVPDGQSSGNALISGDTVEQNAFLDATAWRFATHRALEQLSATPRTVLMADGDLTTTAAEDIYLVGETALAAVDDLTLDAGRRIGLLGAINSNFRLNMGNGTRETGYFEEQQVTVRQLVWDGCGKDCGGYIYVDVPVTENVWVSTGTEAYDDLAYDSFVEIGETLQFGTLMRDVYLAEVPTLDAGTDEIDWLNYARQTGLYDLTSTSVSAGRDLVLNSGGDILNFGGSLLSGENMILTAATDIRNEALRHNFTLTPEHGCVGYGCGRQGHEYKAAEMLSGSGILMSAGGDIDNNGSVIGAAGSILADAQGNIVNSSLTSQYLYHYVSDSSLFGLKRRKEILHRAVISEGTINTQYGDITLEAGNDIRSEGAKISSGGDVTFAAVNDIILEAKAEELANYRKKSGFAGLSYGVTRTYWNEFETAFSQIEGNNISLDAGRDATGIGALLFSGGDIDVVAGEDITFDAHQNNRYLITKGWSLGISFGGSAIIEALIQGDDVLEAYVATNPTLAAVHKLATAENKWQTVFGVAGLVYHGVGLSSSIKERIERERIRNRDPDYTFSQALLTELNPFDWLNGNGIFNSQGEDVRDESRVVNKGGYLNGIKVRLGFFRSRRDWTESYVSQLIAGRDLWLEAGKDMSLVGGTIASADEDTVLSAGENILVAALADTDRSSSSGWGLSLGFTQGGLTFGADFNRSTGQSRLYTNATITAGDDLDVVSGLDTVFMGANALARKIFMDVGQDLIVQSRQNTNQSDSFGFSFSTDGAFSVSFVDADRTYTDTPTTIVAQDRLSIHTARDTYLLGAMLSSDIGNLELNTGSFIFDNYYDSDVSESGGFDASTGGRLSEIDLRNADFAPSYAYSNTQGVTYATVGAGRIVVRDHADFDFGALNRDTDNVQRVISHDYFEIDLPGVNLSRWIQQAEDTVDLINFATARVPDIVKADGDFAVVAYRNGVLSGQIKPSKFRSLLRFFDDYNRAYRDALALGLTTGEAEDAAFQAVGIPREFRGLPSGSLSELSFLDSDQFQALTDQLGLCNDESGCIDSLLDAYKAISLTQQTAYATCLLQPSTDCSQYRNRIVDAETKLKLFEAQAFAEGLNPRDHPFLSAVFALQVDGRTLIRDSMNRDNLVQFAESQCSGVESIACIRAFELHQVATEKDQLMQMAGVALEFLPVSGTLIAAYSCAADASLSTCADIILSLTPGAGKVIGAGAKVVVRKGDKFIDIGGAKASKGGATITQNRKRHLQAVDDANVEFEANGLSVQTEVTLRSCDGTRCRADHVITGQPGQRSTPVPEGFKAYDLDGNLLDEIPLGSNDKGIAIIETKTGKAELSRNQTIGYNEVDQGAVSGVGNNALRAGVLGVLSPDTPVVIIRPQ
ncbi:hypothetical protein DDZ14_02785 [Maritimibacter sp. 55A14]|nr:hypothetical protein DDZ14_02785 [Maritimibacter sp. 55A14]